MVRLTENVFIAGFTSESQLNFYKTGASYSKLIYSGKKSLIPRELGKKYFDYGYDDMEIAYTSIDDAINNTCKEDYCLIYEI